MLTQPQFDHAGGLALVPRPAPVVMRYASSLDDYRFPLFTDDLEAQAHPRAACGIGAR